jgi:hypothetical protein
LELKGHQHYFFPKEKNNHYSSTLSLTVVLDVAGDQRHAPASLPPGMTRYQLYVWLGGHQGRSGRVTNISPKTGFDPQIVVSRYIDLAIPAHSKPCIKEQIA